MLNRPTFGGHIKFSQPLIELRLIGAKIKKSASQISGMLIRVTPTGLDIAAPLFYNGTDGVPVVTRIVVCVKLITIH